MIVARFKVQCLSDKTEEMLQAMRAVVGPSRALPGVIHFDVARDVTDANALIALEVFEDRAALTRRPYRHLDGDRFIAEAVPVAVSACCSRAVRGVRIVFRFTEDTDSHVTERWPLQHWQDQMRVPSWSDAGLNRSPAA